MLNSELITQWMSRLGQRKSTRVREDLLTEINSAIIMLERKPFIPWFLQKTAQLQINADVSTLNLPLDFSLERENTRPYFVEEGTVYYLTKVIAGKIYGYTTGSTRPQAYALIGDTIEFRPIADKSYTLMLRYYATTSGGVLDDDLEVSNLWLLNAPEWIASKACKMTARFHLQNQPLAADFQALELMEKRETYNYHEAREHQNQDYIVGGISDGS